MSGWLGGIIHRSEEIFMDLLRISQRVSPLNVDPEEGQHLLHKNSVIIINLVIFIKSYQVSDNDSKEVKTKRVCYIAETETKGTHFSV